MTFDTQVATIGRVPFTMVELRMDYCDKAHGVGTCEAGRDNPALVSQSATSNTIQLHGLSAPIDGYYDGWAVYIPSGVGAGQVRRVISYVGATRVATLASNWATVPSGSAYYMIDRATACFNTRATCKFAAAFAKQANQKVYYLTEDTAEIPPNLPDISNLMVALPCIKSISSTPARIELGKGLGQRASTKLICKDFTHHDINIDPYLEYRTYAPEEQGTFWGKFITRHLYYYGREILVHRGYLEDGLYNSANYKIYHYVLENISGPSNNNMVTITGKDILKLSEDKRSVVPAPSTGILSLDIAIGFTTSLTLGAGDGAQYGSDGYVRINGEIIHFSSRTNDVLNTLTRGEWGTVEADHKADDSVQLCKLWQTVNVVDIIYELFTTWGNIDASLISLPDWEAERDSFLAANDLTAILSEPMGVTQLVIELIKENLVYIWWDELNQKVRLKALMPEESVITLTDESHFIGDTIKVQMNPKERVTQCWVYYDLNDYTEKDVKNYKKIYIFADPNLESANQYNESSIRVIKSRWFNAGGGTVIQLTSRTVSMFGKTPRIAFFELDAKDAIELGNVLTLNTRLIQNEYGAREDVDFVITEKREISFGSKFGYRAQEYVFVGRYGRISPSPLYDTVTYNTSTNNDKTKYGFISNDENGFDDGAESYKIV